MHASTHLGLIISHFSNYKVTRRFYHYLSKWEHLRPGLSWNLKITHIIFSRIAYHGDDGANVNLHIYLNETWTKIFKIENRTKSIPKYFTIILYNSCICNLYTIRDTRERKREREISSPIPASISSQYNPSPPFFNQFNFFKSHLSPLKS